MKRILYFIGLKIGEILVGFSIFYFIIFSIYKFGYWITLTFEPSMDYMLSLKSWCFATGIIALVMIFTVVVLATLIGSGIWEVIKINWQKAGELAERSNHESDFPDSH